jgi:dTDP-glucose 4,6-dehydratase
VKRLLVTGGAGFIGANFTRWWLEKHASERVVVLDALTYAGRRESLADLDGDSRFRFVHRDIRDQERARALLDEERIDTIVHFAAESHVDRSISGPDVFLETNVIGTHALLKAALGRYQTLNDADKREFRFHHVSTDEVFGSLDMDDPPFHEETPYAPNSPYAASKASSDHLVRAYHHTFGLPVTTTNTSNNYGPYQFPEKLIPFMLVNALDGKPLGIYGDGLNRRDWIEVEDHCIGIAAVLERGRIGETYNIGGGSETDNLTLVRLLSDLVDRRFAANPMLATRFPRAHAASGRRTRDAMVMIADRPGHDRRYAINGDKARKELNFEPRRGLEEGLGRTIDWYLENDAWWRPLIRSKS